MNDINLSTLTNLAPIYPEITTSIVWWPYLVGLGGIILLITVLIIAIRRRRPKSPNTLAEMRMQLGALDFETEPTEALYRFSLLMQSLPESQRPEDLPQLLRDLEPYKYTPIPPPIPEELYVRLRRTIDPIQRDIA